MVCPENVNIKKRAYEAGNPHYPILFDLQQQVNERQNRPYGFYPIGI
jgi:acetone carboxylase gamma subunit